MSGIYFGTVGQYTWVGMPVVSRNIYISNVVIIASVLDTYLMNAKIKSWQRFVATVPVVTQPKDALKHQLRSAQTVCDSIYKTQTKDNYQQIIQFLAQTVNVLNA